MLLTVRVFREPPPGSGRRLQMLSFFALLLPTEVPSWCVEDPRQSHGFPEARGARLALSQLTYYASLQCYILASGPAPALGHVSLALGRREETAGWSSTKEARRYQGGGGCVHRGFLPYALRYGDGNPGKMSRDFQCSFLGPPPCMHPGLGRDTRDFFSFPFTWFQSSPQLSHFAP